MIGGNKMNNSYESPYSLINAECADLNSQIEDKKKKIAGLENSIRQEKSYLEVLEIKYKALAIARADILNPDRNKGLVNNAPGECLPKF
jgi:chromosome segregation ATPase